MRRCNWRESARSVYTLSAAMASVGSMDTSERRPNGEVQPRQNRVVSRVTLHDVRYERSEVLSLIRKRNQPTTQYVKPPASGSLHGNKHHIPKLFLSDVAPKSAEDFDRNVPYASVVDGHRGRRSEVMFSEPLFRVPP